MAKAVANPILQMFRSLAEDQRLSGLSDRELLASFRDRKDEGAFLALLRRHGPMVPGVCQSLLASPADTQGTFQATFLIFAEKAASIRKTHSLAKWLYGVARRTASRPGPGRLTVLAVFPFSGTAVLISRTGEVEAPRAPSPQRPNNPAGKEVDAALDKALKERG
jgi:hypothetical protein